MLVGGSIEVLINDAVAVAKSETRSISLIEFISQFTFDILISTTQTDR